MFDSLNSEKQQGGEKLQNLGRDLVSDLHVYIRSLNLYKHDNKVFLRPLTRMESTINWLIAREGKMHLYGTSSTLYLNDEMLRFRVSSLPNVNHLLDELSKRDIGGLLIDKSINQRQLQTFLRLFSEEGLSFKKSSDETGVQMEPLSLVVSRLKEISRAEIDGIQSIKADLHQYAYMLYHRLFKFVKDKLLDPTKPPSPSMGKPIRILQEFVDLFAQQDLGFLGFTNELEDDAYEAYHLCNVSLLSLVFGRHLGLERLQLLDLSLAALRYNLGKRALPKELLNKKAPLTDQEFIQVKKLALLSAKEILRGPFAWERLRHAIVAAQMQQPIRMGLQPGGSTKPEGPRLYSRIIRLCSCFDSLCTRRPFRPKLQPAEALLFMQKRMPDEFDPYLLDRFVRLFGKMAIKATKKSVDPFEVPDEKRHVPAPTVSVLGELIEEELDEYWDLRRTPFLTERQERRLDELSRMIEAASVGTFHNTKEHGVRTVTFSETPTVK